MDAFGLFCDTFFCCRRSGSEVEERRAEVESKRAADALLGDEDVLRFSSQKFGSLSQAPATSRRGSRRTEQPVDRASSLGRPARSASAAAQPFPRGKFGTNKSVVMQIQELAATLEGTAKKFPHTGLGFSQSRYLAVTPIEEESLEFSSSVVSRTQSNTTGSEDKWYMELRQWRRGWLAYWEDQESFAQGAEPKGHVDLMKISKVEWAAACPLDVLVRFREAAATEELYLQFETEEQARYWREKLHQLRALLQRTVKHM